MMMAARSGKTNWFAIWMSVIAVVAVVAVGGLVVWMNSALSAPAEAPAAAQIDESTGAITMGDGPDTLDTYVDFMCPFCGQFEQGWGDTIAEKVSDGSLTLNIHPVSILDNASQGTEYSTRAANAMYCVADTNADAAYPFMQLLYDNQPAEQSPGLSDDELISYAEQAGAADAATCITEREFDDFVDQTTESLPADPATGSKGTPAVILNDSEWLNWSGNVETELLPKLQG